MEAKAERMRNFKEHQNQGKIGKSYVKTVPFEIDILNKFRQTYPLKRRYVTPQIERKECKVHFEEEFYNKFRMEEMRKNKEGGEKVMTEAEKRDQSIRRLMEYSNYQNKVHCFNQLGNP